MLYQNALYGSLTPTRRASLSAAVAQALLDHYGEQSGEVASELAFLLETARDFSRASQYFLLAAQNAARVFANQEAIVLARRGLELLQSVPAGPKRDRQELMLHMALSGPLMATKGHGSTEVEEIYRRVQDLCQQVADSRQVFFVLTGLIAFYGIRANHAMAKKLSEHLMDMTEGERDPDLLLHSTHALGFALSYIGELARSRELMQQAIGIYDHRRHSQYSALYAIDLGVDARCQNARNLWLLGCPDQAVASIREALALAEKISHPFSLALALLFDAKIHQLRRDTQKALQQAERALEFSKEHGLPQIAAWAGVWRGWALTEQGRKEEGIARMRESLAAQRAMGSARPHFLVLLAESLVKAGEAAEALAVLAEAFDVVHVTGECYYEAELHRLKGETLLSQAAGQPAVAAYLSSAAGQGTDFSKSQSIVASPEYYLEAEACFRRALEVARRQGARSLELRAAMSLVRLSQSGSDVQRQSKNELQEIYNWFTEGFDTKDLQDAKGMLG